MVKYQSDYSDWGRPVGPYWWAVSYIIRIITGRNEVVAKVIFLHLSVILFTGGVSASVHAGIPHSPWEQTPPGADSPGGRHPPGADTPPGADNPPGSRHPQGADMPPQSRHPREQIWHPLGADNPREQTPPQEQTPLGADTLLQEQTPQILVYFQCFILVYKLIHQQNKNKYCLSSLIS